MRFKEFFYTYKEKIILTSGAIGIGLISFAITILVYDAEMSKQKSNEKPELENKYVYNQDLTEAQRTVAENLISKLDELEKSSNNTNNKTENKTKVSNNNVSSQKEIKQNEQVVIPEVSEDNNVIEAMAKNKDLIFVKPVEGDIGMDFCQNKLVYSKTLKEWISHKGIDYILPEGTDVKATANGTIHEIYKDLKLGYTIVIKHNDEYMSKYSGLQEVKGLEIGQNVKQGDVISKIGEGFGFEKEEGSHLHFEVIKNGKSIEPIFM